MRTLADRLGVALSWIFAAVVVITVYEVIARYAFHAPTSWAQELTMLVSAVAFAFGGAYVQAHDGHIRITVFTERLRGGALRAVDAFGRLLGVVFLLGIVVGGWRDAWEALSDWQTTQSAFDSPMPAIVKPSVIVASVLMLGILVADIARTLRGRQP